MGLSTGPVLELEMEAAVIDGILERHERAPSSIIAILQDI